MFQFFSLFWVLLTCITTTLLGQEESSRHVLVTGGAGYIGSQTCKALWQKGYIPVTYDSLHTGKATSVKWGPLVVGDISDRALLNKVIEQYQPVGVIHFAASISVGESVAHPSKYYWNNVVGTLNLLEAVKDHGIEVFIFSSTAATYGIPEGTYFLDESAPQSPINPYGNTKLAVEKLLKDYSRAYGMRYVCFRYFNAAGADLDTEIGPNFSTAANLVPIVIQVAAKKRPYLQVFGTDFPTPDGTGVRDYIHVMDIANAHVLALDYLLEGQQSITMNLGTGSGHSVSEIIKATEKITNREVPISYTSRREGDPPAVVADAHLAKEILGWEPCYSDLDTILQTTWNWYQVCEAMTESQ